MAENSNIEWTTHTFNPWRGCTKVSPGCANCYAEKLSARNPAVLGTWGPDGKRVVAAESYWREPLKWNREAKAAGERQRVFCASLADVFEDWPGPMLDSNGNEVCICHECKAWMLFVQRECNCRNEQLPQKLTMDDVRERLFFLIRDTPNLDWLLLTKRPENILGVYARLDVCDPDAILPNLFLGVSVEDQLRADERREQLRSVPAAVKFVSYEPALGPVNWTGWEFVNQIISGGESGPQARPSHPDWHRATRDFCLTHRIAYFFKQWGEYGPEQIGRIQFTPVASGVPMDEPSSMFRVGKKAAGRLLDGREWSQFPAGKGAPS